MRVVYISAVRDFAMYEARVRGNPCCAGGEFCAVDNRARNDGVPVCYNRALDSRPAGEDAWYVFCHEDFELKEPLAPRLEDLDRGCLWGPIGAATEMKLGLYPRWTLRGEVEECRKDGSGLHRTGTVVPQGTPVETFDCQCLIVHSSLVRSAELRFDEQLSFDLYAEDLCIAARERHGAASRVLPLACRHWSGGSVQARYYVQEAYLARKWPKVCATGTSSWIIGGGAPLVRRAVTALKRLCLGRGGARAEGESERSTPNRS